MKVILFGATGMVGQGVLRECLLADDVTEVLAVGRTPVGRAHPKLRELAHRDFTDFTPVEAELAGYDACFYCLGVSSVGRDEADYTVVTHDYTVAAATVLARLNPEMTFVYVSGAGTDSTERGRVMWARVKGRTENAVLALFPRGCAFRPGIIQPVHGAVSKTRLYRVIYAVAAPLFPVLRKLAPKRVTTTELVGRAMLRVARTSPAERVLENGDLT